MPNDRLYAASKREQPPFHVSPKTGSTTLPSEVQQSVPQCARQCLSNYLNSQYGCADNSFDCLCNQYSSEGFTLGELAYICLKESCRDAGTTEAKEAYFVCNSDPQAVQPTHATLTVPQTTASGLHTLTKSSQTTTRSQNPTTNHKTTMQTTVSNPASTTRTALSAATEFPQSQTLSPSAATEASRPAASAMSATGLTPAQAAGISIAAMSVVILAIAGVWLIACIRRRKKTKKDDRKSYDFVDEAPPRFSPFNHGHADPRGPLGGFQKQRAELTADKETSNWARSHHAPDNAQKHEKSVDMSRDTYRSHDTNRSQLLPDKPYSTILRSFPKSPAPTTATIFEEDRPHEIIPPVPPIQSTKALPRLPPAGRAIYYPPPAPTKASMMQYAQQYQRSPEKVRHPSLSLEIPRQASRLPRAPSPVAFPLPPYVQHPARKGEDPSTEPNAISRESEGSLFDYYASPEAGFDASPEEYDSPTTPIDEQIQRRKGIPNAITITKPIYPPRAIRVDSNGSDTSFESNLSDEATPPEELDRQLTPVLESPISRITYPKIPRSSNQAVARSPKISPGLKLSPLNIKRADVRLPNGRIGLPSNPRPQHRREQPQAEPVTPLQTGRTSSILSGSTLAAKRIGNSAAQDLERRLQITNSTHSRTNSNATTKVTKSEPNSGKSLHYPAERNAKVESPLKGYGRVASERRISRGQIGPEMKSSDPQLWRSAGLPGQPQEVMLNSPLWAPKLTPQRKGDELYLSVGTPMTDNFAR